MRDGLIGEVRAMKRDAEAIALAEADSGDAVMIKGFA